MKEIINSLNYYLLRLAGWPVSFLSYKSIHRLGRLLGTIAFYVLPWHRKITINQIALAKNLKLNKKQRAKLAEKSFQNLCITGLEYFRIKKSVRCLEELVVCENMEVPRAAYEEGKGMVLISSHQANWELPFLDINSRHKGIAIGRPIANKKIYNWILSIRELYGGKIIEPKKAISMGMKHLKKGEFVGIVCDQAMPESSYTYDFYGTRSFVSPSPALLAYRAGAPLLALNIERRKDKYFVKYSPPIYPRRDKALKEEIKNMMDQALSWIEKQMLAEQYFWQHRRFKQHPINDISKKFRWDCFLVIADRKSLTDVEVLKKLFPRALIDLFLPEEIADYPANFRFRNDEDLKIEDERYQIVLDLRGKSKLKKHFLKSAFYFFDREEMQKKTAKIAAHEHFLRAFFLKPVALRSPAG